jgi:hypothetical protein
MENERQKIRLKSPTKKFEDDTPSSETPKGEPEDLPYENDRRN